MTPWIPDSGEEKSEVLRAKMTTVKSDVEATDWKWPRILLVIAPPLGYTLAYTYERGYCGWFEIPKELIMLDWTTIIIGVSAALAGSSILMWFIAMLLLPGKPGKRMGPIRGRAYFFALVFFLSFFVAYKYLLVKEALYVITYLATIAIILFLMPIFDKSVKGVKGYRAKLEKHDELRTKTEYPFMKRLGLKGALIIMLLFGVFFFSYLEGRAQAMNQDEFYVPSTYPNSVVLRIYGDNIICAPVFDKARGEVEKTFFILKTNDEPRPMLIATKTGQLHIKQ